MPAFLPDVPEVREDVADYLGESQAVDAEVAIAGSGNIVGHASGTAEVSIMGSGDVSLTGGAKCSINKQGSGNVHCS